MMLVCHLTSQDHLITGSCDFKGGSQSKPAKFGDHRHSFSVGVMVFVCHVTLQYHVINVLNDFMARNPSRYITILPNFAAMGTGSGDLLFKFIT